MHPAIRICAIVAVIGLSAWLGFLVGRGQVVPAVVVQAPAANQALPADASRQPFEETTVAAELIKRISQLLDETDPNRYADERVEILAALEEGLTTSDAILFGPALRYFNELVPNDSIGLLLEARSLAKSEQWFAVIERLHGAAQFPESNEQLSDILALRTRALGNIEAQFETAGDWHGLEMYAQQLSDRDPHSDRLRLLIARAQIELDQLDAARETLDNTGTQDVDSSEIDALAERLVASSQPQPVFERRGEALSAQAAIDGVRFRLLVDTGASVTALSTDLLRRVNAEPLNRTTRVLTAGGAIQAELYRVPELVVQNQRFLDHRVLALDDAPSNWDGLLGMDIIPTLDPNFAGASAQPPQ